MTQSHSVITDHNNDLAGALAYVQAKFEAAKTNLTALQEEGRNLEFGTAAYRSNSIDQDITFGQKLAFDLVATYLKGKVDLAAFKSDMQALLQQAVS